MGSGAWQAILRWRVARSSGAAGACGKVFAVHETRCGGRLFENRYRLREGPTDIIRSANDLPSDRVTVMSAETAPTALFFRLSENS